MEPTLMTAAEAMQYIAVFSQTTMLILTGEITVIFGYLAAVHYFLREMNYATRIGAYLCVMLAIVVFWWSLMGQSQGYLLLFADQWDLSVEQGAIDGSVSGSYAGSGDQIRFGTRGTLALVGVINLIIVVGVTYFSFFDPRRKEAGAR